MYSSDYISDLNFTISVYPQEIETEKLMDGNLTQIGSLPESWIRPNAFI